MPSADSFLVQCNLLMCGQPPKEILRKALATLEDPSRWTQGALARDQYGRSVRPASPHAVCWCMESAVAMACNPYGVLPPYFMILLDEVAEEDFGHLYGAPLFNEHYGHDAILTLLKLAIHRAPEVAV